MKVSKTSDSKNSTPSILKSIWNGMSPIFWWQDDYILDLQLCVYMNNDPTLLGMSRSAGVWGGWKRFYLVLWWWGCSNRWWRKPDAQSHVLDCCLEMTCPFQEAWNLDSTYRFVETETETASKQRRGLKFSEWTLTCRREPVLAIEGWSLYTLYHCHTHPT